MENKLLKELQVFRPRVFPLVFKHVIVKEITLEMSASNYVFNSKDMKHRSFCKSATKPISKVL